MPCGCSRQQGKDRHWRTMVQKKVIVLMNLAAGNSDNKVKIASLGGIPPLIDLLKNGTKEGKE